jgi:hypothetical protein
MAVTVGPPASDALDAGVIDYAHARQRSRRVIIGLATMASVGVAAILAARLGGDGRPGAYAGTHRTPVVAAQSAPSSLTVSTSRSLVLTRPGQAPPASVTAGGTTVTAGDVTSSTVSVIELPDGVHRATITVSHACAKATACVWFGEASQRAGSQCPARFDPTRSIWAGPVDPTTGTEHATVTYQPTGAGRAATPICVYAHVVPQRASTASS